MGSVDEAEVEATFINVQDTIMEILCLEDTGYNHSPTKVQIYYTTSDEFDSGTIKQKYPKEI